MSQPYVLIVDDVELNRLVLAKGLEPLPVAHAADAAQALEQAFRAPPTVVLLDLGLPEVDGMTLLRVLRQWDGRRGGRTPVIVVSGTGTKDLVAEAAGLGIDGFLVKPVDAEQLRALVRQVWVPGE